MINNTNLFDLIKERKLVGFEVIAKIEEKIKEAKEILAKSDAKIDDLNKASEDLGQILQTVGAATYQQQQPGQPGPDAGQANPEEPKADSKSDDKKEAEEGEVVQ